MTNWERRSGVRFHHTCPCCGFIRRCTTGGCLQPPVAECPECAKLPRDEWLAMAKATHKPKASSVLRSFAT